MAGRKRIRTLGLPDVNRAIDTIEYFREKARNSTEGPRRLSAHARRTIAEDHPWGRLVAAVTLAAFLCPIERFPTIDRL